MTGSGKSTQIPQYIYEAGITEGMIAVTQPRRVAAMSLAKRVSEERGSKLGQVVGYAVRFDDVSSSSTRIKFLTDGMLLRELLNDKLLRKYSVIILDECHERSVRTDILMGVIKGLIFGVNGKAALRPALKVIVMSATMNADLFSKYFNNAPVKYVEGRMHHVQVYHTKEPQQDYLDSVLLTIFQIHMSLDGELKHLKESGNILVFLTGQEEIESIEKLIKEYAKQLNDQYLQLVVCPLFANLPPQQQQQVFEPTPKGYRKVILATNVAQTSITIPGVKFVIDCGLQKSRSINFSSSAKTGIAGMESLGVCAISKSSALQRTGRAGREAPGICYRMYTEKAYLDLPADDEPEIRRCNLSGLLLNMACFGIDNSQKCSDVVKFDFMDRPSRQSLMSAMDQLLSLGGLDDTSTVTDLGRKMAKFPLDPPLAKILISASEMVGDSRCLAEVIDLISLVSVENIWFSPHNDRQKAYDAKIQFASPYGDHITLLNMLQAYLQEKIDKQWCVNNYVNGRAMHYVMETRQQLRTWCQKLGMDIDYTQHSTSQVQEQILRLFQSGFPFQIATLQQDGSYKDARSHQQVHIHPSSLLFGKSEPVVMYYELVQTTKKYMRTLSIVVE